MHFCSDAQMPRSVKTAIAVLTERVPKVNESFWNGLLLQKGISWCLSTDRRFLRSLHGMNQRLLLQFRLVPFSISPHTAKGRLKHLCAFLVPSLWLINYVLPQRGHREAQRFLELGLRPRRPRLTAEGRPKHLCALLAPPLRRKLK